MRRSILIAIDAVLLASAAQAASQVDHTFPRGAEGLRAIELSQLLSALLPSESVKKIVWDYQPSAPLKWLSSQPSPDPARHGAHSRMALARVRVHGARYVSIDGDLHGEQAWTVRLSTAGDVKAGPTQLDVSQDMPDDNCVASRWAHCWFDDREMFKGGGLRWKRLCSFTFRRDSRKGFLPRTTVYLVSAPGKHPTVLEYGLRGNIMGGQRAWAVLYPSTSGQEICRESATYLGR